MEDMCAKSGIIMSINFLVGICYKKNYVNQLPGWDMLQKGI